MRTTFGVLVGALLVAAPAHAWHGQGSTVKQFGILSVQKSYSPPAMGAGFYPTVACASAAPGSFIPAASYAMPAYFNGTPSMGYAFPAASYPAAASYVPMSVPQAASYISVPAPAASYVPLSAPPAASYGCSGAAMSIPAPAASYIAVPAAAPSYAPPAASYGCAGAAPAAAAYAGGYAAGPAAFPIDAFTLINFLIQRLGPQVGGGGGGSQDVQNLTSRVSDLERRMDRLKGLESAADDIASIKSANTRQNGQILDLMNRVSALDLEKRNFVTRGELDRQIEDLRKELKKGSVSQD